MTEEKTEIKNRLSLISVQFDRQTLELNNNRDHLKSQIIQLESQITVHEERLGLADRQVQQLVSLKLEDAASESEVIAAKERMLILKQELERLFQQKLSMMQELDAIYNRITGLPDDLETSKSQLRERLAGLSQRRTEIERQARFIIRAPFDGKVAALQVRKGQALRPGQLQMAILPFGSELVAELYAPTRAAGFIKPGQNVRLLYDAFPYQRFGAAHGIVERVSKTVLSPEDGPASLGIQEPIYRLTVNLEKQAVNAFGEEFTLQDGMTLKADIILEKRTILEWLFEPLLAISRR